MTTVKVLFFSFLISWVFVCDAFAQKEKPIISFGLISDIQYADCDSQGTRFYRNSLRKTEEAINYFNDYNVDFTIHLGDIIDREFSDIDSVLIYLKKLDKKIYHLTGNHDYKGFTDNQVLYEKLDMPSDYYYFKKKNWIFIMLNTNEIATYSNIIGTEKESELIAMLEHIKSVGGNHGASWNGGIGAAQLRWLNKLLEKSEKSGNNVLIFTHHPLYPQTAYTALNNMEILNTLEKYTCVKAIFSGHHHSGDFTWYGNIPVVTIEGMIETEKENSFGVVEIYKNKIVLKGEGRMTSRTFNNIQ